MNLHKLIEGNKKFRKATFSKHEDDFNSLVKYGQNPKILFIGCSDSRVVPDLFLDSEPGEMFILRNVGNFVPPYSNDDQAFHGCSAVIEYAVSVLKVEDIIVCGHSHCGACASLYDDTIKSNKELGHVNKWLTLGEKAKQSSIMQLQKDGNKEDLLRITEKISIKYQLENLLTFPQIKKRVESKELTLNGWYYKIEDGTIEMYDKQSDSFICPI
ncbi:MAG: carbonic anhydrase [Campylobacterales bacterium]|nr:carbonic anhydrase [Campylobacterales bacterium]